MLLHTHKPEPPLDTHVEYLWHLRDVPGHTKERVLPTGTLELVINLARDAFHIQTCTGTQHLSGSLVSGVYQRFFVIDTRDHADILGVHFRPGGAWPVLGVAPGVLADRHFDLGDLWGHAHVSRLRAQLLDAPVHARLAVLEAVLATRMKHGWQLHCACAHALDVLARGARVADVASDVGLSSRRLQAVFLEQVGTTPKLFARISRLQRALGLSRLTPSGPGLAIDAGYCDQSHMIREFHALAGFSPVGVARALHTPVKQHHLAAPSSDLSNT